jgi:hypothetical protein
MMADDDLIAMCSTCGCACETPTRIQSKGTMQPLCLDCLEHAANVYREMMEQLTAAFEDMDEAFAKMAFRIR